MISSRDRYTRTPGSTRLPRIEWFAELGRYEKIEDVRSISVDGAPATRAASTNEFNSTLWVNVERDGVAQRLTFDWYPGDEGERTHLADFEQMLATARLVR